MREDSGGPFDEALAALAVAGVRFVVVGVGGINFYARRPDEAFATQDIDVLLHPSADALRQALKVLSSAGFTFEAGDEPFVDAEVESALAAAVRAGALIRAVHVSGAQLDLMLSIAGFAFAELERDARGFEVAGQRVLVARLEKLLQAKEIADRPKDRAFIEAYRSRHAAPPRRPTSPRRKKPK